MLKNCSKCKSQHTAPFGSRCKQIMATAVIEGYDRDDPNYLKLLEDEFCELKRTVTALEKEKGEIKVEPTEGDLQSKMDTMMDCLGGITDRLKKLETGSSKSTDHGGATASPASMLTTPLTKALAKLAGEEEDRGKALRPETYAQGDLKDRNRDHTKLDTIGLFYGWICIARHLLQTGGDLRSYINHIHYATQMLNTRQFFYIGAIKYDRAIVDKYLEGRAGGFDPDPVVSSITFSSKIIPDTVELCPGASLTKGVISYQQNKIRNRRRGNTGRRSDETPPDFPQDICFMYNYRQCLEDNCNKSHTCRKCSGKHRADNCRERSRKS